VFSNYAYLAYRGLEVESELSTYTMLISDLGSELALRLLQMNYRFYIVQSKKRNATQKISYSY
jgi:hypothetical protein